MAATPNPRTIEGLYALGVPVDQLVQIQADVGQPTEVFRRLLRERGITNDQIDRANNFVNYRPETGTPYESVRQMLEIMGRGGDWDRLVTRTREISPQRGLNDTGALARAMDDVFGLEVSGAMRIKTPGLPYKADGGAGAAVWNPFRGDKPPDGVNIKWGAMGVVTALQPEGSRDLPQPPTPVQQKQQAVKPPAPGAPALGVATGAAPGAPAPGARGGGGPLSGVSSPATWSDDEIKNFIRSNFGANAYFIDIPEVWEALRSVVKGGKGVNGLQPAIEQTQFWKQTNSAARNWFVRAKADPAQTAADIAQQSQALATMAQNAGLTIDPARLAQIAESSLRYGWTNTDIQRALAAEWHYDPTTKNQAAAVTAMKQTARNWLVPLSDQAIQTWGQGLIAGTTTDEQFTQYLRDNAKSLFPQLSAMIDAHAGDPNFSIDTFVDPYRTQAANLLGVQPDQVDFSDPKWRRPLDTIDPKTGERRIMTLSEWQSTLKTDPQYGYDKTQNGVNEALTLAQSLTKSMGF